VFERLAERGESNKPEYRLMRLESVLETSIERTESDIPLSHARRAAFNALEFQLERLTDCVERAALERLTERGESKKPEYMLLRLEFVLETPIERSELDIPLLRARRAAFNALEFALERLTDRIERAALDTRELGLKPSTQRTEALAECDKLDALEFTRPGCSRESVLDSLAERAELGLVSLVEGRDPDTRCVGLDIPNSTGHENCVGYQP